MRNNIFSIKNKFASYLLKNLPLVISVIFWLFISFFLVRFVNHIFSSNEEKVIENEKILLLFLSVLSTVLLVFIIVYIIKLIISVIRNEFGSKMRLRMTLVFIFLTALPIIPFIQIGTKFIESSMNVWFSEDIGASLDLSEEVIKEYYDEKKLILIERVKAVDEYIKKNSIVSGNIAGSLEAFIRLTNANNITLWDKNGRIIGQAGDKLFDISSEDKFPYDSSSSAPIYLFDNYSGIFFQEKSEDLYLIIPSKIIIEDSGDTIGFLNIASKVNPNFKNVFTKIEDSLRSYNIVSLYKKFFIGGFSILFVAVIFPIILIVLVISIFLTKEFVEPIANLSDATKRIAKGDYNFIIERDYTDEFKILVDSFNSMIGEIEFSRKKLSQKEKIATWQEIARRMAHEIKNPLTPIRLSSERVLKRYTENRDDFAEILTKGTKIILGEVDRMDRLLREFSNIAKLPNTNKELGGIYDILKDLTDLMASNSKNIKIILNFDINNDFLINRDSLQLKSVFMNIIQNALDSMKNDGVITIDVFKKIIGFTEYAVIKITDQGEGVVTESDADIFEPYYSTKENGIGLGLAIVQRIVQEHEGRIYYETKPTVGTSFFIELPIASTAE
ncbi:MAG TPA: ATP-binding protein [Spirochaetota bacterium]|nr:ATP-binding protein [Spirochaetota bacterium]HOS55123.1 ATP-binding protein [Spirochaetota bacterium]HPK61454.1 ATP-binding protein [Spirochaetota bacterium]HQF77630.1 ATP-binding protein [Spirochaetota bacterium]HQH29672.1 ATP-binding protein [Spirochaetota bacterium]